MTRASPVHVHRWLEVVVPEATADTPHEFWCPDCGAIEPDFMKRLLQPVFDIHTDTPTPGWHP